MTGRGTTQPDTGPRGMSPEAGVARRTGAGGLPRSTELVKDCGSTLMRRDFRDLVDHVQQLRTCGRRPVASNSKSAAHGTFAADRGRRVSLGGVAAHVCVSSALLATSFFKRGPLQPQIL